MIAFGVVAHETRRAAALELAESLDARICVDDGTLGATANHRRLWETLADTTADWMCVLEDDAQPVTGFGVQLAAATVVSPSPVISLYLGTSRPPDVQRRIQTALTRADRAGACWVTADRMLHAVGICLHRRLVADMLTHTRHVSARTPADERFNRWLRLRRLRVAYAVPSLVEHADGPTLIDHRDGQARTEPRTAWRVGTPAVWSRTAVAL